MGRTKEEISRIVPSFAMTATEESTHPWCLDIHLGTLASGKHHLSFQGSRLYLKYWQQIFCLHPVLVTSSIIQKNNNIAQMLKYITQMKTKCV